MPPTSELVSVFLWMALAAVLGVAGFLISVAIRRWTQRDERTPDFTIQDLREMQARGEITPREFEIMRSAIVGRFREAERAAAGPSDGAGDEPR